MKASALIVILLASLCLVHALDLKDRVGLVTGGTKGIGKDIVSELVAKGAKILFTGRSKELGKALEKKLNDESKNGGKALYSHGDVTSESDQQRWIDETLEAFGRLDFALANAGILSNNPALTVADFPIDEVRKTLEINTVGSWITMKLAIPELQKSEDGVMLFMTSIAASSPLGLTGYAPGGAYLASKAAQTVLVRMGANAGEVRSYGLAPAFFLSEIVPAEMMWSYAPFLNPIFTTPGINSELVPVVEAFLDGSSLYPSGSSVLIDHAYTMPAQENYNQIETGPGYDRELNRQKARDATGKPVELSAQDVADINAARLAERPSLDGTVKDEL